MTARNLTLTIGGRAHVIAVPPEDEAHITALAQMIDEKVRAQGPGQGQTEARIELPPGKHTLQLVLGDADHFPFNPPVVSEKITITIR